MSRYRFFIATSVFLCIFLVYGVRTDEVNADSAKACAFVNCGRNERCMNRKFWCKKPPCPNMLYCSRTTKESLKGPTSCHSVRCSRGYICHVKVRRCRWDQKCLQQIARCVSEREYYEGPASCADFKCPSGQRCILRESLCVHPPCKLLKSCAKSNDVKVWHNRCKTLGCPSEFECFLRRPPDNCPSVKNSCKHTPDCTITNVKRVLMNPDCQGWVCPRHQECSALVPETCDPDKDVEHCNIKRSCHGPLAVSNKTTSTSVKLSIRPRNAQITNIEESTWRAQISELSSIIPTEGYDQELNHHSDHPATQTTSVIGFGTASTPTQTDCNLNQSAADGNFGMHLEKWSPQNGSIYRAPVYVRIAVNGQNPDAGKSAVEERPTDSTITQWLEYLRLKTGVDAINVWAAHAEEDRKYRQFTEWLTAVKTILGPHRFEIWLTEIKKLTSEHPAFQKWLLTTDQISQFEENHAGSESTSSPRSPTMIPEQNQTSQLDESTEDSDPDIEELTDIRPSSRPENGSLTSPVDQVTPKPSLRLNARHPRINYRKNRGYKHHRGSGPRESKNGTMHGSTDRPSTPQHKIDDLETPDLQNTVKNNHNQDLNPVGLPIQNRTVDHSLQTDRPKDDNASSVEVGKDEVHHTRTEDIQVSSAVNKSGQETGDEIRGHDRHDPGPKFNAMENPDRVISGVTGAEGGENLTKIYNLFTSAEDGLGIISPWDALRVFDHGNENYYTMMGFPPERGNRVQIIGYPVIVSKNSANDEPKILSQHPEDLVGTPPSSKSNDGTLIADPVIPWSQILWHPSMIRNSGHPTIEKQRPEMNFRSQQPTRPESKTDEKNTKESFRDVPEFILTPSHDQNDYQWDVGSRKGFPDAREVLNSPKDLSNSAIIGSKKTSKKYDYNSLNSEEYMNAYIDALIEHALSKMILNEQLRRDDSEVNWKTSARESVAQFSQNQHPPSNARVQGKQVSYDDNSNMARDPKTVTSMSDTVIRRPQITATSVPNLSTDFVVAENDHLQYGCDDQGTDAPEITEIKEKSSVADEAVYSLNSASDDDEEYYSEESEQQEYVEGSSTYQTGYVEEVVTNSTDYDFQYYYDEEYDEVVGAAKEN